ncbi:MAG: twin-arginine translocation pathway signal, partial [Flammeovirgaceae bacterium]
MAQNASGGTDHASAAPRFLFGGMLKGGLIGNHPGLAKLKRGDLVHHTDFRSVYATLLEQWLKTPSAPVLG